MPNQQRAPAARTGHRRLLPQARLKLSRTSSCARRGPRTHSAASRSPPCPDLVPIFLRVADDDAEARSYDGRPYAYPRLWVLQGLAPQSLESALARCLNLAPRYAARAAKRVRQTLLERARRLWSRRCEINAEWERDCRVSRPQRSDRARPARAPAPESGPAAPDL
eukprot:tig00000025_g7957.t1